MSGYTLGAGSVGTGDRDRRNRQINLMLRNTIYVLWHFHATMVAGTTLSFMALACLVRPLLFQRQVMFPKLAKWKPYLFGIGVSGISHFMMGAGTLGVPRRHRGIGFTGSIYC